MTDRICIREGELGREVGAGGGSGGRGALRTECMGQGERVSPPSADAGSRWTGSEVRRLGDFLAEVSVWPASSLTGRGAEERATGTQFGGFRR